MEVVMSGSYIVAGARTPIGKMSGALASFTAADLGGFAIKAALERAGVSPEEVEHVIMGQVLMAIRCPCLKKMLTRFPKN